MSSLMANSEVSTWLEGARLAQEVKKEKHPTWEDVNWHLRCSLGWYQFYLAASNELTLSPSWDKASNRSSEEIESPLGKLRRDRRTLVGWL